MRLAEFLEKFPGVRLAGAADNARLLAFFEQSSMQGDDLRLRYSRSPDFFAFLRLHSDRHFVFFTEENGAVTALGTVIIRPGYLNGQITTVGYLGDLRIRPSLSMGKIWRRFYSALIENVAQIEEFSGCRYFLTAIIDENQLARRALVDRKSRRPSSFTYDPMCAYEMVNCLHRWPLLKPTMPKGWSLFTLAEEEAKRGIACRAQFLEFYDREQKKIPFGYPLDAKGFQHRLDTWPGLSTQKILIMRINGRIVGALAPYCPSAVKKIIVDRYPAALRMIRKFITLPEAGQELSVDYLTHLQVATDLSARAQARVFSLLLTRVWATKQSRLVAFASLMPLKATQPTRGFLTQRIPMTLYAVRNSTDKALTPEAPGFEMALV